MTEDEDVALQFESAPGCTDVLRHFDPEDSTWNLPKHGSFWHAVAVAHHEGRRGAGRRIGVIDGAFDLSLGGLRQRAGGAVRLATSAGESTDHGTAVALLIAEVAPEATLDLYEVAVAGKPSGRLIRQALREAVAARTDVVNLSIGHAVHGDLDAHRCSLRDAVENAIRNGALIVVACGNYSDAQACPAQVPGAVALGYSTELRTIVPTANGGTMEVAAWQPPTGYDQTMQPAFTLQQPPGVLGSSFAAPLAAALAALADDPSEITRYRESTKLAGMASLIDCMSGMKSTPPTPEVLQSMGQLYQKALKALPQSAFTQVSRCPARAVLTEWILVNAGRFCLFNMNLPAAETLLRQALWLAPWSADAAANLGRLVELHAEQRLAASRRDAETRALLTEAEKLYVRALQLSPANTAYDAELRKIRAMAAELPQ